jgi:hypothetical protein
MIRQALATPPNRAPGAAAQRQADACRLMRQSIFGSVTDSVTSMQGSMREWYESMAGTGEMLDA